MVSEISNARDSTRRSVNVQIKNAKGEWVEKVYDYVTACSSQKGKFSDMKVIDFESRHTKRSPL